MTNRPAKLFLGWARGQDKHGDETGVWHAVTVEGDGPARAACSGQQRTAGQVEPLPQGARVCDRIGCQNQAMQQARGTP